MDAIERLAATEAIRQAKARYWRGVDTGDLALIRSVVAEDCELDYRGCFVDPKSGRDFLPAMNMVMRGRAMWSGDGLGSQGIVSVHQGHQADIEVTGPDEATAIFAFTDHLWLPPGAEFAQVTGHGFYHETYVRRDGAWLLRTLRITRLRCEGA